MNPNLRDFFNQEKKRFFTPDPFFHVRVLARIGEVEKETEIWDVIPSSTRPVFGLALMLMLTFLAVQLFVPQIPERGFVTAILEAEQTPAEAILFSGADMPADQELLNRLMVPEERQ
jgi:hypothetical protein